MEKQQVKGVGGGPDLKKMEKQITLNGQKGIEQTPRVLSPIYFHTVLNAFYGDFSGIGLSLVELKKRFCHIMHPNTIKNAVHRAKSMDFLVLVARNVGPNKRRKYYKITEKGALFLEGSRLR